MAAVDYAEFFRDRHNDLISLGLAGAASANIRAALRMLGYNVTLGDDYDEAACAAVRSFQSDMGHTSVDGAVGPGTRRLLADRLIEEFGDIAFGHFRDPATGCVAHDTDYLRLLSIFDDGHNGTLLAPGQSGAAVQNLRQALGLLGYPIADGSSFDDDVRSVVLRFQLDNGHANRDGCVGPGTRRLLATQLIERYGHSVVNRFQLDAARPSPHIFVSYKREDRERFAECLKWVDDWGYTIWYDEQIPGSADWYAQLEERLTGCGLVLAFLSQSAVDSKWVQREIFFGDSLNKPVLPIWLEPIRLHSGLKFVLSQYQHLNAGDPGFKDGLHKAISFAVETR